MHAIYKDTSVLLRLSEQVGTAETKVLYSGGTWLES
jgi:hypothetical protein